MGIVGPISSADDIEECYTIEHWQSVRKIIQDSYPSVSMHLVSDSNSSGIILDRIIKNLAEYDLIICDTSSKNPNVMFELGLRLAFDKPVILVKDELTSYSFDISLIEHVDYTSNLEYTAMLSFQKTLASKINHFTENDPDSFLSHFTVTNVNNSLPKKEINGYEAFKDDFEKLIPLLAETKSLLSIEHKNRSIKSNSSSNYLLPSVDLLKKFIIKNIPLDEIKKGIEIKYIIDLVIEEFDMPSLSLEEIQRLRMRIINALKSLSRSIELDEI